MNYIEINNLKELKAARLANKDKWVVYTHKDHALKCFNLYIQIHQSPDYKTGGFEAAKVSQFNDYFSHRIFTQ